MSFEDIKTRSYHFSFKEKHPNSVGYHIRYNLNNCSPNETNSKDICFLSNAWADINKLLKEDEENKDLLRKALRIIQTKEDEILDLMDYVDHLEEAVEKYENI